MGKATWILIANILANVFLLTQPSEFPAFFDEDDLKSMGVKGHKSQFVGPTVTGRYTEHMPGYRPSVQNDQTLGIVPPNGLPRHYMPPQMLNKKPFKPLGRGDPRDQNIVQQMEDEEDDSIFPKPDGKPYGGEDFTDLDQLPDRLTKTNKWAEFKELLAEEGEKYKGKIMENWEDDAHMWASYSRHLLERSDHDKQKAAARKARPKPVIGNPSIGMQQYWGEDTIPSPKGQWGQPPAEGEGFGSWGQGGSQGSRWGQGPGGAPGLGGSWGQGPGGGQGPSGGQGHDYEAPNDYGMGRPPTPNSGQGGSRGPGLGPGQGGGQVPGRGWGLGGAPPPGWGQGRAPKPGHGRGQGLGGVLIPGGTPGLGEDWGTGGGWSPGGVPRPVGGWSSSGAPGPGGDFGRGGVLDHGGGRDPGGVTGPGGDFGPGGALGRGGGRGPGGAAAPGGVPGPSEDLGSSGGQSLGRGQGPGGWGQGGAQGPSRPRTPPMMWNRRQMNDDMEDYNNPDVYSDNLKGPLPHVLPEQPYYKGNKGYPGLPDNIPTGQDDSYLIPGQRIEQLPEFNYDLRMGNLGKLKPSLPMDRPNGAFDENFADEQVPGNMGGKMPGPGSERDYPNGYRPNYGRNPKELFDSIMNAGMSSAPPGFPRNSGRGGIPTGMGPFAKTPAGLREGGGFPSTGYSVPRGGGEGDYPESIQKALRMARPGFQGQPGPGAEGAFPQGFRPSVPGGNMERGLPPGSEYMHRGKPPGMRGYPPAMQRGRPSGMGVDRPPWAQSGGPPGMDGRPPWAQIGVPLGMQGGPPRLQSERNLPPSGWRPEGPSGGMGFSPPGEPGFQPQGMEKFPAGMPMGPLGGRGGPADQTNSDYPGGNPSGAPNPDLNRGGQANEQEGFKPRNKFLPTGYQLMKIAQKILAGQERMERLTERPQTATTTEHAPTKEEMLRSLRQYDDFQAPVRWVPFNSKDTRDGLARVTDKETHKNQQFIIEGELFVPIVDESMSRLGWTTEDYNATSTESPIKPPIQESAIKVVMRSMNLNNSNEQEWLAYEVVLGAKASYENECDGESCQSRCYKTGCDTTCKGDTCAAGCVGVSCNAVCKSPGCFSMCIGEQCSAKCEGLNCESRCWGKHCDASCKMFSCAFTTNGGRPHSNNATWEQMYPQYDHRFEDPDAAQRQGPGSAPNGNEEYYY